MESLQGLYVILVTWTAHLPTARFMLVSSWMIQVCPYMVWHLNPSSVLQLVSMMESTMGNDTLNVLLHTELWCLLKILEWYIYILITSSIK